jgi:glutamate-1-semialdehyde 2,1-aminomutase
VRGSLGTLGADWESPNPILQGYLNRTKRSLEHYRKSRKLLPAGVTRNMTFTSPHPTYLKSGKGSRVTDIDGNVYIDFLNNYTSLIHGHADPDVIEAVSRQLKNGTAFGLSTELEYKLAELVSKRMPSIENMRFCNSGTEATLFCLLGARAMVRRRKIVKFEGGFHGNHESVMISVHPKGPEERYPRGEPDSIAVTPQTVENTYVLPFNELEPVRKLVASDKDSIAAVIVEPVMGVAGMIPARREFLTGLREICSRNNIILIFDEIITGFRLSMGGGQEYYHVKPDLTSLGKLLGGGFPVGGFGGSREIMAMYDPTKGPKVPQSGTFSSNPVTLTAGYASLSKLKNETYRRLNGYADEIKRKMTAVSSDYRFPIRLTGAASLFNFHFTDHEITNYRGAATSNPILLDNFYLSMLNEGILMEKRGLGCISTPMGNKEIQGYMSALASTFDLMQNLMDKGKLSYDVRKKH